MMHAIAMLTMVAVGVVHVAEPLLEVVSRLLGCASTWAYPKRSYQQYFYVAYLARLGSVVDPAGAST